MRSGGLGLGPFDFFSKLPLELLLSDSLETAVTELAGAVIPPLLPAPLKTGISVLSGLYFSLDSAELVRCKLILCCTKVGLFSLDLLRYPHNLRSVSDFCFCSIMRGIFDGLGVMIIELESVDFFSEEPQASAGSAERFGGVANTTGMRDLLEVLFASLLPRSECERFKLLGGFLSGIRMGKCFDSSFMNS